MKFAAAAILCAAGVSLVFAQPASASYSTTVISSNPVSYYRLEETSGTTSADLGSKNLTANYTGTAGTSYTQGQAGIPGGDSSDNAVLFSGTNGFISDSGNYSLSYPITIEAFIKTTASGATNMNISGLTNNSSSDTAENIGIYVQSGKAAIRVRTGQSPAYDDSFGDNVNVADGKWHQVVGVFDSTTQRELYVDGVLAAQSTTSLAQPVVNTLGIGALARSTPADFFNGTIDEVAVFNSALSASTISAQYAASGVPEPAALGLLALGSILTLTRRRTRV